MTTKKGRQLLRGKSAAPQIRKSWLCVREKGPRLTLVWGPRMVNPALVFTVAICAELTAYKRLKVVND